MYPFLCLIKVYVSVFFLRLLVSPCVDRDRTADLNREWAAPFPPFCFTCVLKVFSFFLFSVSRGMEVATRDQPYVCHLTVKLLLSRKQYRSPHALHWTSQDSPKSAVQDTLAVVPFLKSIHIKYISSYIYRNRNTFFKYYLMMESWRKKSIYLKLKSFITFVFVVAFDKLNASLL